MVYLGRNYDPDYHLKKKLSRPLSGIYSPSHDITSPSQSSHSTDRSSPRGSSSYEDKSWSARSSSRPRSEDYTDWQSDRTSTYSSSRSYNNYSRRYDSTLPSSHYEPKRSSGYYSSLSSSSKRDRDRREDEISSKDMTGIRSKTDNINPSSSSSGGSNSGPHSSKQDGAPPEKKAKSNGSSDDSQKSQQPLISANNKTGDIPRQPSGSSEQPKEIQTSKVVISSTDNKTGSQQQQQLIQSPRVLDVHQQQHSQTSSSNQDHKGISPSDPSKPTQHSTEVATLPKTNNQTINTGPAASTSLSSGASQPPAPNDLNTRSGTSAETTELIKVRAGQNSLPTGSMSTSKVLDQPSSKAAILASIGAESVEPKPTTAALLTQIQQPLSSYNQSRSADPGPTRKHSMEHAERNQNQIDENTDYDKNNMQSNSSTRPLLLLQDLIQTTASKSNSTAVFSPKSVEHLEKLPQDDVATVSETTAKDQKEKTNKQGQISQQSKLSSSTSGVTKNVVSGSMQKNIDNVHVLDFEQELRLIREEGQEQRLRIDYLMAQLESEARLRREADLRATQLTRDIQNERHLMLEKDLESKRSEALLMMAKAREEIHQGKLLIAQAKEELAQERTARLEAMVESAKIEAERNKLLAYVQSLGVPTAGILEGKTGLLTMPPTRFPSPARSDGGTSAAAVAQGSKPMSSEVTPAGQVDCTM
ncbi:hypothetical protein FBU30_009733 [Linnemannia zychae]|nr:hypothetical protein FBU30_009733 [Linnemannia zychae]